MAPRSLLLLAALLLPGAAPAAPAIVLFPALGRGEQVVVSGRVLQEAPSAGSSTLSKNLRRLMAPNWEGAVVTVGFAGLKETATSGSDGAFAVTFTAPKGSPFEPGVREVSARVDGAQAVARVGIVGADAPFFVISDFDDTLAVTNVTSTKKLLKAALLEDGHTQPVVPGMAPFYQCLHDGKPSPPGFALVSGSPVQYVPRTNLFLAKNGFPFFGLYLRDLGPSTLKNYKQPFIRKLLGELPHKAVLIGDSGEHDPEVYAEIRAEAPSRISRIYIHDVGRSADPKRFEGMVLFQRAKDAADDAVAQGLITAACRDRAFGAAGAVP
ncbi:MAG: phosphatase domain-containing protein [Myxococcaceae bacterium]